jgi:2-polyprenyl-3-methyl-5-hydroxy-6-metoxy-1,4-benzoquinol methylase
MPVRSRIDRISAPISNGSVDKYLFASQQEFSRLAIQARAWAPAAAIVLDEIGVAEGSHCIDVGCGAMGILPLLSARAGADGVVVGIDKAPELIAAARALVTADGHDNVRLVEADIWQNDLSKASFDLVHARFVLPHVGDAHGAVQKLIELAKPGGVVLLQEPDHNSWSFHPQLPEWRRLLSLGESTMEKLGVDMNIGRRTFQLLRSAGLEDVTVRAAIIALQDRDPYMRMALTAVSTIREPILRMNAIGAEELDALVAAVERHIDRPDTYQLSFTTTQVWGRRPLHRR